MCFSWDRPWLSDFLKKKFNADDAFPNPTFKL